MADETYAHARGGDRRSKRGSFHVPERRSGFDRRREDHLLRRLSTEPALLLGVLVAFNVLSMLDWILTVSALGSGAAEANLIVRAFASQSLLAAALYKMALTLAVSVAIWYGRRFRLVVATAVGAVVVYLLVIAYHMALRLALA